MERSALDQMIPKHDFIFSTDCYQPDSIKAQERLRRGFTEKYIINGPHTQKPYDWGSWGSNDAASRLEKCKKAVVCVDGKAYDLTSTNGEAS